MSFGKEESKVIQLLREVTVATMQMMCGKLSTSRSTVMRALKRYGYFSSCNFNSSYFTLKDTPRFDQDGLWFYDQILFSRYGTLSDTIKVLVEHSGDGCTVSELQDRLKTQVHNQLSQLCRRKMLSRFYVGRQCVYTSVEDDHQAAQQAQRIGQIKSLTRAEPKRQLPKEFDALTVIRLLVQMIQTPDANPTSLSEMLERQGVSITAEQVQSVIKFYTLEKKMEP